MYKISIIKILIRKAWRLDAIIENILSIEYFRI